MDLQFAAIYILHPCMLTTHSYTENLSVHSDKLWRVSQNPCLNTDRAHDTVIASSVHAISLWTSWNQGGEDLQCLGRPSKNLGADSAGLTNNLKDSISLETSVFAPQHSRWDSPDEHTGISNKQVIQLSWTNYPSNAFREQVRPSPDVLYHRVAQATERGNRPSLPDGFADHLWSLLSFVKLAFDSLFRGQQNKSWIETAQTTSWASPREK